MRRYTTRSRSSPKSWPHDGATEESRSMRSEESASDEEHSGGAGAKRRPEPSMSMRHFLEVDDLSRAELVDVLDRAEASDLGAPLLGKGVALYFEKPSLRTRHSSEMAVVQLGGHPVTIRGEEIGAEAREP